MKVPHEVIGRTRPSSQGLGYLQARPPDLSAIGRGAQVLAAGLSAWDEQSQRIGAKAKERQDRTDRFNTLTQFSDFELKVKSDLLELKRNAPVDGQGFTKQAADYYQKAEQDFLATIPTPELQEEFKYRSRQVRAGVLADSINFQYEAGDANYRQGIDKVYQRSLVGLDPAQGGDPRQLEKYRALVNEAIDTSDLSTIEKEKLKLETSIGIEAVAYKQAVKNNRRAGVMNLDSTIGGVIETAATRYGVDPDTLKRIAWLESRGNPNAKNPSSSAGGLFQFIDDTARRYGLKNKYDATESADAGARLARDNAGILERALGRKPTGGELYLAHQQGAQGALNLLQNPNALATDIVGQEAVRLNGGAPGMTAGQFAALWDKKFTGASSDLDSSPAFSHLPYDQRVALSADADAEVKREDAATAEARKNRIETRVNDLLNGITAGTHGLTDIQAAFAEDVTDFDTRQKIMKHYGSVMEAQQDAQWMTNLLGSDVGVFNSMDTDHMKRLNNWAKEGVPALTARNENYVTGTLLPSVERLNDVSPITIGTLDSMARSSNREQQIFALETLLAIQDKDSRAFSNRTEDRLEDDVDTYRRNKETMVSMDDTLTELFGGGDETWRAGQRILEEEAKKILQETHRGEEAISQKVAAFKGNFEPYFGSVDVVAQPALDAQLSRDYQTSFIRGYKRFKTVEGADEFATKQLNKLYGVTDIDGNPRFTKWPPEQMGYKPLAGDMTWINNMIRAEVPQIKPTDQIILLGDDQTKREFDATKRVDANGQPLRANGASYMISVKSAEGEFRMLVKPDYKPWRKYFDPLVGDVARDQAVKQGEAVEFERRHLEQQLQDAERAVEEAGRAGARGGGQRVVPEAMTQRVEELRQQLGQVPPTLEPTQKPEERAKDVQVELDQAMQERDMLRGAQQQVPTDLENRIKRLQRELGR